MGSGQQGGRQVDVAILGRIRAASAGRELDLGGPRQQALVAALAVEVGRTVTTDALIEAVWDGDPPDGASRTFRSYVARLRRALDQGGLDGAEVVRTDANGYRLDHALVVVDAGVFAAEVEQAREQLTRGEAGVAADLVATALARWEGRALGPFADRSWAAPSAVRLEEQRLAAGELQVRAVLDAGRTHDAVALVEQLAAAQPLRESVVHLHAVALYRAGRDADALQATRGFRERLAEGHGLDPSPRLVELETMVLDRDPRLDRSVGGRRLRGYVLHEPIARTPLGTVHRAEQPSVGREVAITVLPAVLADDPDVVRAFESRVQAVAGLDHPHVLPVYDYWREPGAAYVVTRFPAGGTLAQRLRSGPLDAQQALRLGEQVASAVASAHERGVVHGALTADTVVVDERGDAFLWAFPTTPEVAHPSVDVTAVAQLVAVAGGPDLPALATAVLDRVIDVTDDDVVGTAYRLATDLRVARDGGPAPGSVTVTAGPNPYRGLAAFRQTDAGVFFGRRALVDELLGRFARTRAVAVVGPSGSGKSSAVRAGVLPALRADGAFVTTMVPGSRPLAELEIALSRVAAVQLDGVADVVAADADGLARVVRRILPDPAGQLVLVVDQFEELFTLSDPTERDLLLTALRRVVDDVNAPARVVLTLRADFLGRVLEHPTAGPLVRDRSVMVGPLTDDELHEVVTGPAEVVGVAVEPALATAVVTDAARAPGSLPMVQFALTEVYAACADDGAMTLAAYRRLGGIEGVLGQRAEEVFARLDESGRRGAHAAFQRLVVPDTHGPPTRRRALRRELSHVPDAVLEAFGTARLLRFDHDEASREPTVEVTHEALFREWPRLVAWVDAGVDDLRLLGHLTASAEDWDTSGRDDSELYRGNRLDAALAFASDREEELTSVERDFLAAARGRRAGQQERERRGQQRLRRLTGGLAMGLVVALVAGGVAWTSRQEEASVRADAQADALAFAAIAALEQDDVERASLLAAEAYASDPDIESQGALLGVLGVDPRSVPGFATPGAYCSDASGDASRIAFPTLTAGGADIEIRSLEGDVVETVPWRNPTAWCVTLSPTTDHLVQLLFGGLQVEDRATGTVVAAREDLHFQDSPQFFALHPSEPQAVLLVADGTVAFTSLPGLEPVATGEVGLELGAGDPDDPTVTQAAVGYSEDGSLAFAAEAGTLHVFDAADGRLVDTHDVQPLEETVSGHLFPFVSAGAGMTGYVIDHELVVTSLGGDGTTRRIDLGSSASPIGVSSGAPVGRGVAVEPGGRRVAVVTEDGVVVVDLERGALVGAPLPSDTTSLEVRWTGAGELLGLGSNGAVRFDVDRQLAYGSLERDDPFPPGIIFPASDGSGTVLDGPELVFLATRGGGTHVIDDADAPAAARALPGGRWLSARRDTGIVRVGDVDGVLFEQQLPVAYDAPSLVALRAAGDRVGLVVASIEGEAGGWVLDGTTGEILTSFESDEDDPLEGVAPLGDDLALVRTAGGTVTVHSSDGGIVDEPRVFAISNGVVAGSPSGRRYVVADFSGTLNVVDRETGDVTELVGAFATPASVDFVDDGRLVSHHGDGSTFLWDIQERRRVGELWSVPASFPATTAVDRSTGELVQPVEAGLARVPLDPEAWLEAVCARVSRTLTDAERGAVVTGAAALDPCGSGRVEPLTEEAGGA